jgi:hypothetical protein
MSIFLKVKRKCITSVAMSKKKDNTRYSALSAADPARMSARWLPGLMCISATTVLKMHPALFKAIFPHWPAREKQYKPMLKPLEIKASSMNM